MRPARTTWWSSPCPPRRGSAAARRGGRRRAAVPGSGRRASAAVGAPQARTYVPTVKPPADGWGARCPRTDGVRATRGRPTDASAHPVEATAVLEIHAAACIERRLDSPPHRPGEQLDRLAWRDEAVLLDLPGLEHNRFERLIIERAAVEQEAEPSFPTRLGSQKVDAHEPAVLDAQPTLLERLTLAGHPGRL